MYHLANKKAFDKFYMVQGDEIETLQKHNAEAIPNDD